MDSREKRNLENEDCKNCVYSNILRERNEGKETLSVTCNCIETAWFKSDKVINLESNTEKEAKVCPYFINRNYMFQNINIYEHYQICECCKTCVHNEIDCKQRDDEINDMINMYYVPSFHSNCPDYHTNQYQMDKDGKCTISSEWLKAFLLSHERMYLLSGFEEDNRKKFETRAVRFSDELREEEERYERVLARYEKKIKEIQEKDKNSEFLSFFESELPEVYKSLKKEFRRVKKANG